VPVGIQVVILSPFQPLQLAFTALSLWKWKSDSTFSSLNQIERSWFRCRTTISYVSSVLGLLHYVVVGNIADVSEAVCTSEMSATSPTTRECNSWKTKWTLIVNHHASLKLVTVSCLFGGAWLKSWVFCIYWVCHLVINFAISEPHYCSVTDQRYLKLFEMSIKFKKIGIIFLSGL
jgi:hypothetical protein